MTNKHKSKSDNKFQMVLKIGLVMSSVREPRMGERLLKFMTEKVCQNSSFHITTAVLYDPQI